MINHAIISQRCDFVRKRDEYRDSIDINWYKIINDLGLCPIIMPNEVNFFNDITKFLNLKLIILTGGGDVKLDINGNIENNCRNKVEIKLIELAIKKNIKLVGVCRGQQIINLYFGGKLSLVGKNGGHNNQKHQIIINSNKIKQKKIYVNSYHNYFIESKNLASSLNVIGKCVKDNSIEIFKHKNLEIYGISWHPERRGKKGLELANMIFKKSI